MELVDACTPQYEPTFDNVHANTLLPSCALGGCHGEGSSAGGLSLGATAEDAHEALVAGGSVIPTDASCSPLMQVLTEGSMPPGAPLDDVEQCAVQQWIAEGAKP